MVSIVYLLISTLVLIFMHYLFKYNIKKMSYLECTLAECKANKSRHRRHYQYHNKAKNRKSFWLKLFVKWKNENLPNTFGHSGRDLNFWFELIFFLFLKQNYLRNIKTRISLVILKRKKRGRYHIILNWRKLVKRLKFLVYFFFLTKYQ